MEDDIVLRIKEKESLEVIKIILGLFGAFLFILGAMLHYEETVVEVCIMWVFAVIVDVLNDGEFIVSQNGIKSNVTGYVKYREIYRVEFKNRMLVLYTRNSKKKYMIFFAKNEDYMQIERIYKFIDSKIKRVEEDIKDHKEFVEKFSK